MKKKFLFTFMLCAALGLNGCSIKLGPDPVNNFQASSDGLLRLGDVTETLTGTWTSLPNVTGIKPQFLGALKKPEAAAFFGGGMSSPVADIQLTTDHEDDGPRLSSLGALSMVTFGIIPLNFHSEWNVQCKVTLKSPEGDLITSYNFMEKGTYEIWAFPLTMFSLFGAGTRGPSDAIEIYKRISESLLDKIMQRIEKDSSAITSRLGGGAGSFPTLQKSPII